MTGLTLEAVTRIWDKWQKSGEIRHSQASLFFSSSSLTQLYSKILIKSESFTLHMTYVFAFYRIYGCCDKNTFVDFPMYFSAEKDLQAKKGKKRDPCKQ